MIAPQKQFPFEPVKITAELLERLAGGWIEVRRKVGPVTQVRLSLENDGFFALDERGDLVEQLSLELRVIGDLFHDVATEIEGNVEQFKEAAR
jgi:hypothetical protein